MRRIMADTHVVRVRYKQRALLREVVVQVGDDLHRDVRLARARGSNHHGQTRIHTRTNGLHLHRSKGNRVALRHILRVRAHAQRLEWSDDDALPSRTT